jgi:hypothetical protein
MDKKLGPYPFNRDSNELYNEWVTLVDMISPKILTALISPVKQELYHFSSMSSKCNEDSMGSNGNIEFTPIDCKRSFPPTATGAERTKFAKDKSWYLSHLIESRNNGKSILLQLFIILVDAMFLLGELQIAFVILLFGHNFEGLEQWKNLTHCIMLSREAITNQMHQEFFSRFFTILESQLKHVPKDFFEDFFLDNNFLVISLKHFAASILFYQSEGTSKFKTIMNNHLNNLNKLFKQKFKWDLIQEASDAEASLDLEEHEDPPTIVE